MMATRPQPPATPPAIGAARELLIIGVNAVMPEDVTEDVAGVETGVIDGCAEDDCAAIEDAAACKVTLLLSMVELAGNSVEYN
jgi:hypothetical protein